MTRERTRERADVVICGAGIAGIAAAYHLAVTQRIGRGLLVEQRATLSLHAASSDLPIPPASRTSGLPARKRLLWAPVLCGLTQAAEATLPLNFLRRRVTLVNRTAPTSSPMAIFCAATFHT